jgi:hypothetical protein
MLFPFFLPISFAFAIARSLASHLAYSSPRQKEQAQQ